MGQLAAERGMAFVCAQPLMSGWARRAEDLTSGKTDDKDAVLIARLAAAPGICSHATSPCPCLWMRH